MSDLPSPVSRDIESVQKAISFAAWKHRHQERKDRRTPYVAHPFRVFFTVRHVFQIDDVVALCAAALHDTIEDTLTDYDEILELFGEEVADAVAALTKEMRLREDVRESVYDEGLTKASWQARAVKLADVYDNFCDAPSQAGRDKVVEKIHRAIACAGDDERLRRAVEAVRGLLPQE
jgi:(p)ppGpp synthase/HD superfamily hydrolase